MMSPGLFARPPAEGGVCVGIRPPDKVEPLAEEARPTVERSTRADT